MTLAGFRQEEHADDPKKKRAREAPPSMQNTIPIRLSRRLGREVAVCLGVSGPRLPVKPRNFPEIEVKSALACPLCRAHAYTCYP